MLNDLKAVDAWEVVVIGAGVAGSVAACVLAEHGRRVLLVEREQFPRYKICGCCLNARSVAALRALGLADALREAGAIPLMQFQWHAGGRKCAVALKGGLALSRAKLDTLLRDHAEAAGAVCLQGVRARVVQRDSPGIRLLLEEGRGRQEIQARAVVCATGLLGRPEPLESSVPGATTAWRVAPEARVGVGTMISGGSGVAVGSICMASGVGGYVGMVRVEGDMLNVAAAVDAGLMRRMGAGRAVREILEEAGMPAVEGIETAVWKGTAPLTRQRVAASGDVFFVGDAVGYVEPFTGEGMAWAIEGAVQVAAHVERKLAGAAHQEDAWQGAWKRRVGRRQWMCRGMAGLLRRPALTRAAVRVLSFQPWLASPLTRQVGAKREEFC